MPYIHEIKENLPPIRVIKRVVNTFLRLGWHSAVFSKNKLTFTVVFNSVKKGYPPELNILLKALTGNVSVSKANISGNK